MADKSYDVFISYSTKDTETAYALLNVLEGYGLKCWIAPRNIPQGAMWAEEIDKAIQGARVFVVIVSSHSMESKQVPKEVALAVTACEGIFPFRIDDSGLQGTFRYYLSDYQFTDATKNSKQKMEELAASICYSLGRPIPQKNEEPEEKPLKEIIEKKPESSSAPVREEKKAQTSANTKKPGKGIIIGAAAAAAAVIIILAVVFAGKGSKQDQQTAASAQDTQVTQSAESTQNAAEAETKSDVAVQEQTAQEENTSDSGEEQEETAVSVQTASGVCPLFGRWEKTAYKDKGVELNMEPIDPLVISYDGTVYTSLAKWAAAKDSNIELPALTVQGDQTDLAAVIVSYESDPDKYDLNTTWSFKDSYNGEYDSSGLTMSTIAPYRPGNSSVSGDNPTDLTYDDVYPDVYLYLNITGTVQTSPVKKEEADTWIVYRKKYPIIHSDIFPAFEGEWTDSMGNVWNFAIEDEDLTFSMTDSGGNTYAGDTVQLTSQDSTQKNFFERIRFIFDDYSTDKYAVVSFDGRVLELLDESWNSFTLTKK